MLDTTSGGDRTTFTQSLNFARNVGNVLLSSSTTDYQVGLAQYDETYTLVQSLGTTGLPAVSRRASTRNTGTAMDEAVTHIKQFGREQVGKLIVLITRGVSNPADSEALDKAVKELSRSDSVEVLTFAIGDSDDSELIRLAKGDESQIFQLAQSSNLPNPATVDQLASEICFLSGE